MPTYRTPDVYVEEISVFPPSVAEVESAIPAFIGYTAKAEKSGQDLHMKPTMIRSKLQFEEYFGGPQIQEIKVDVAKQDAIIQKITVTPPKPVHNLAECMHMFFANGGGKCYVVSVGKHGTEVKSEDLAKGLSVIAQEDEPTLLVVPEAVLLSSAKYASICTDMLAQCGVLKDRFALLDVQSGDASLDENGLKQARESFGTKELKYGAAYYPFLKTALNHAVDEEFAKVTVSVSGAEGTKTLKELAEPETTLYNAVKAALKNHYVVLPPSAAVAGVCAWTDTNRGVWKAPANISLNDVIEPVVKLDSKAQEDFNIDSTSGKSINAIRAFSGKGTLVWGARTLMGNDNEWRYVNVRRFFNMVEESVKKSTSWAVFEPNDANTWVKVRGMIENYLTQKWREGALAGATIKEAFFVRCGLGSTMNSQDILEGRLIVEIGMAVVRPAEFIILKFSHKLQTS